MRLALIAAALVAAATPLAAQQRQADTTELKIVRGFELVPGMSRAEADSILRAATDSGWRFVSVRDFRLVADTATMVIEQQKELPFGAIPRADSQPAQLVATERRVERRKGKWARR